MQEAWGGTGTAVCPLDELVEGAAYFVLGDGAVAFAVDVLLDQILAETGAFDDVVVEGERGGRDERVVESVEGQHGFREMAVWGVVAEDVFLGVRIGGVAADAIVEGVVAGGAGGVGSGVEVVAVVEGIAAGAVLHVCDDEGEVGDVGGDAGVGVQRHERTKVGGGGWVDTQGSGDFFADGGGVLVVGR